VVSVGRMAADFDTLDLDRQRYVLASLISR
jgi:hypothetical protein